MALLGRKESRVLAQEYSYDPHDVWVAVYRVVARDYGEQALKGFKRRWWLPPDPVMLSKVNVGPAEKALGLRGTFRIKDRTFQGAFDIKENVFQCWVKERFQKEAKEFLLKVQKELDTNSIYRGKAFTTDRQFLDLNGVSADNVVFPSKTEALLKSQLWSIIEQPESCAAMNVFPQRKVLFCGPFGSGKTLTALLTAKKGIDHKWTVIYMPPTDGQGSRNIEIGLVIARKYQPAIFIFEDVDHEQQQGNPYAFRQVLASLDGLISKGSKIIVVMTTNFKDKIAPAILRPERIDQIIDFELLARDEVQKLIQKQIPLGKLSDDIDWGEVYRSCSTYPPAFIKGMATSAALRAIGESQDKVTQEMLVKAAKDLRFQFEVCEKAIGQYI